MAHTGHLGVPLPVIDGRLVAALSTTGGGAVVVGVGVEVAVAVGLLYTLLTVGVGADPVVMKPESPEDFCVANMAARPILPPLPRREGGVGIVPDDMELGVFVEEIV